MQPPAVHMEKWTAERIPDQSGRLAIVTGANSGLGEVTARELPRVGARVVLACRNLAEGRARPAGDRDRSAGCAGSSSSSSISASVASVRGFAERFRGTHERLDILVNNAGVMATPRRRTADGFELQFGTNHLGHFALTGLLIGAMEGRRDARVVTLSSSPAYRIGRVAFDNLGGERPYFRWRAYAQSKLANLLFMLELDRRLRAAGSTIRSLGAHPGYADTNLQFAGPPLADRVVMGVLNRIVAQSAEMGEQRGHPTCVSPSRAAQDEKVARRLWEVSEQMTGVRFVLDGSPPRQERNSLSPPPSYTAGWA